MDSQGKFLHLYFEKEEFCRVLKISFFNCSRQNVPTRIRPVKLFPPNVCLEMFPPNYFPHKSNPQDSSHQMFFLKMATYLPISRLYIYGKLDEIYSLNVCGFLYTSRQILVFSVPHQQNWLFKYTRIIFDFFKYPHRIKYLLNIHT